MKIQDHQLFKDDSTTFPFSQSPNVGGSLLPEYLVMHYTAGRSSQESVSWFMNPNAKASAHLVIGRDGNITQLVPFNVVAWHAGQSFWEGHTGLNQFAIGIELDNAGRLTRQGNQWTAWFGDTYDDSNVMEAIHKNESTSSGWHLYTPVQIEVALQVASMLVSQYRLRDVVGHEDIAPGRKSDPGPAFPMRSFQSRVMGRAEAEGVKYETTVELNIRTGPGTQYTPIPGSPLPMGSRVELAEQQAPWWRVDVLDAPTGVNDMHGWVHSRYLKPVKTGL